MLWNLLENSTELYGRFQYNYCRRSCGWMQPVELMLLGAPNQLLWLGGLFGCYIADQSSQIPWNSMEPHGGHSTPMPSILREPFATSIGAARATNSNMFGGLLDPLWSIDQAVALDMWIRIDPLHGQGSGTASKTPLQ